jgi:Tfp pilus assembly protein PilX
MNMKQSEGFVSLFTTIMISLLLIIITTSMVSLEVLQLRKSEDSEQSTRAYYIAEAGVEEAVSRILTNPTARADQPCAASTNYDTTGAAEWTCQKISFSGAPVGVLKQPDAALTVDPGHVTPGYQSVIIEWNQSQNPGGYNVQNGGLPGAGGYTYSAPPLELAIVSYPTGGFSASQVGTAVKLQNALIVPKGPGTGVVNYANGTGLPGHGQWAGSCENMTVRASYNILGTQLGGYNCYAVLTNLPATNDYLFRIRSRYLATNFKMTFKADPNGGGAVVKVPDGMATIDVTAKAGDTYRRVLTKLPLNTGAAPGLDYVMYSDTDICKNFDVLNNAFPSSPGC